MVHRRQIEGEAVYFGNQGALWGNAMTWWDHSTGSVWSQPRGEAILGDLAGARLDLLPSRLTTWGIWLEDHPRSLAIDTFGFPMVVGVEDVAIVVEFGDEAVAYDHRTVLESGVVNDVVAGVEIAVWVDPGNPDRWSVLSRRLDDHVVELRAENGVLVDGATGTSFDPVRGLATDGLLQGENLDLLPALTIFPADFATFWPNGEFFEASRE